MQASSISVSSNNLGHMKIPKHINSGSLKNAFEPEPDIIRSAGFFQKKPKLFSKSQMRKALSVV